MNLMKTFLRENRIDILCIQEADIGQDEDMSTYNVAGYEVEFEKSHEEHKVRTLIYIHNLLEYSRRRDLEKTESHIILISLPKMGFGIASIYRTYKLTHKPSHAAALEEQMSIIKSFAAIQRDLIIAGDLNLDYNKRADPGYHLRGLYDMWLSLEDDCQLVQCVDFTTWSRTCQGQLKQSILDHVLTNNVSLVESIEEGNAPFSDHIPVIATLDVRREEKRKQGHWIRNWKNYSPELLTDRLSRVNWNIDCSEVQDYSDEMEQKIMTVLEEIIPFQWRNPSTKKIEESPQITRLKRKRKNLLTNAKRRGSVALFVRSRNTEKKIRSLIARAETNYIRGQVLNGGPQGLWKGVRLAQDRPVEQIPETLIHEDGTKISKRCKQAEVFAAVFQNKIRDITSNCAIEQDINNGRKLVDAPEGNVFPLELVQRIMADTKAKNSHGFDNIPMRILRDGAAYLAAPYHKLMEMIYRTKNLPEQWRVARVLPLYKKGSKSDFRNYRPISNLCVPSKIFEKCILKRLEELANEGNLFTEKQHGFRKGRSTVTAARVLQLEIARAMDDDKYIAVASLDLSAAFDVVNIGLLLKRLEIMGLPKDILALLKSWLTDRKAYVEVDGECSDFFDVTTGTVQGSVLGPVLFNLFIRPMLETCSGPAYADDSYHLATGSNRAEALDALQEKITEVERWMSGSGLKVNLEKTELTVFHRIDTSTSVINVKNIEVKSSPVLKVLGLLFDNRMQWDKQVEKATSETRRSLQGLRLLKRHFNEAERLKLITSMCYSRLYYGSQVWLLPTLKDSLFKRLFSQSGQCLKILNSNVSYANLHKDYLRATPKLFLHYQTAVSYYEIVNEQVYQHEKNIVESNTLSDRRNAFLTFVRSNKYRVGLNLLSNRLRAISGLIPKNSISYSKNMFKTYCKINIIQRGLSNQ